MKTEQEIIDKIKELEEEYQYMAPLIYWLPSIN